MVTIICEELGGISRPVGQFALVRFPLVAIKKTSQTPAISKNNRPNASWKFPLYVRGHHRLLITRRIRFNSMRVVLLPGSLGCPQIPRLTDCREAFFPLHCFCKFVPRYF